MNETLNPGALKAHRIQRGWSQKDLVEKTGLSTAQVSRWERGESLNIHQHSRDLLTKAFNKSWVELTVPPKDSPPTNLISRTVKLTASVKPDTRTALEMVQMMYGVNRSTIIELAPLLFLITAQSSLEDRRSNIDGIKEMIEEIKKNSKAMAPHLADSFDYFGTGGGFVEGGPFIDSDISTEEKSIEKREVFGPFDSWEYDDVDPYINYLKKLAEQLPKGLVDEIKPSTLGAGGSPTYRLSRTFLKEKTGVIGETDEEKQLLAYIEDGSINLRELLSQKENLSETKYSNWLSGKFDQAKNEADELDNRIMDLIEEKHSIKAFRDELRKETMRNAEVKMEDVL